MSKSTKEIVDVASIDGDRSVHALTRAVQRVGTTPRERLAWLVGLCNQPRDLVRRNLARGVNSTIAQELQVIGAHLALPYIRLAEPVVQTLDHIEEALRNAAQGKTIKINVPGPVSVVIDAAGRASERSPKFGYATYNSVDPKVTLSLFAADLLVQSGDRVAICANPSCLLDEFSPDSDRPKLFVWRTQGRYCSQRCARAVEYSRMKEEKNDAK